ncbi:MAG: hypothetical protein C0425_07040 [Chlorobiaceae bacterium]|nr:hypothetical protein [Chlorobiaceae bacterium]MBA4310078.1 hypothetical protein [Chlorobiaceae bacterium]
MVRSAMLNDFMSLGEVINNAPELKKVKKLIETSEVINRFNEIFPQLEKIVEPIKLEKNTLVLKVENPSWRNELFLQKEILVEKINEFFQEERIKQIIFLG